MPMFRIEAWGVVHKKLLQPVRDELLTTDFGMDLLWCGLVEHAFNATRGSGCGVSSSTKIEHFDTREIINNSVKYTKHLMPIYNRLGLNKHTRYPSWKFSKHPCIIHNTKTRKVYSQRRDRHFYQPELNGGLENFLMK